ncbi:MAG: putative Ig domain-containing protein [Gemmataceae bacterium]|nr:putative Ig domain-containing protein [Gemmataceae bacterium]
MLSFTPPADAAAGVYNLIVLARDTTTGITGSRVFQLTVNPPATHPSFSINGGSILAGLPLASPLAPYNATISAAVGADSDVTLTWKIVGSDSTPPAGLVFQAAGNTLSISGTPTILNQNSNYYSSLTTIEVTATDSTGTRTSTQDFVLACFYTAAQSQQAYGISGITFAGGVPGTGKGVTVAVAVSGDAPNLVSSTDPNFQYSDLYQYDQLMGLNAYASAAPPLFLKVDAFGGSNYSGAGDAGEITQDVEWIHALAPEANIILVVNSGNFYTGYATAQTLSLPPGVPLPSVFSTSYSSAEGQLPPASIYGKYFFNPLNPAAPTTYVVAGADADGPDSHQIEAQASMGVVMANYTQLTTSNAQGAYGSEAVVTGSGGGPSSYAPQPPWQNGVVGVVSNSMQTSPEVTFNGSNVSGPAIYNSALSNGEAGASLSFPWVDGDGSSIATPSWAALFAIANQGRALKGLPPLSNQQTLTLLYANAGPSAFNLIRLLDDGTTISPAFGNYNPWAGLGSPIADVLLPALSDATVHVSTTALNLGTTTAGTSGAVQGYTLSGVNLSAPITVTAPAGVELSFDAVAWSSSLSFTPTAGTPNQAVYARIRKTAVAGPINGIVIRNTSGAVERDVSLTGAVEAAPAITSSPPPAQLNQAYSFTYTFTGFPAPTFSVTTGNLPPGLSLSLAGVISGTPTATGTFSGIVTAANGINPDATQSFSITVRQAPSFVNQTPPATATVGQLYTYTFTATGFPAPTFSVVAGTLPAWLTLNSATGVLSGTPLGASAATTVGSIVVRAFNSGGNADTAPFSIAVQSLVDLVGVVRPGDASTWLLDQANVPYAAATTSTFSFGASGDIPVTGDWDGDGFKDAGVFRPGTGQWFLDVGNKNYTTQRAIDFGMAGDVPVVGHWRGDTVDYIGVFRPSTGQFLLSLDNQSWDASNPAGHQVFSWGTAGDVPVVGDWDGDNQTDVGTWRPSIGTWFLDQGNVDYPASGNPTIAPFQFGTSGDVAVVGKWVASDKQSRVGVFRPSDGTWFLSLNNQSFDQIQAITFQWGLSGDIPVTGDWNADGGTDTGVYRPLDGTWFLDQGNVNYPASGNPAIAPFQFGANGDTPVTGAWQLSGLPQLLYGPLRDGSDAARLTDDQLATVVAQAILGWQAAGVTANQQARLRGSTFIIGDLPSGWLGQTVGNVITVDAWADGYGWSFGSVPRTDRIDLLTVVQHELGHVLGLSDLSLGSDAAEMMALVLAVGQRRQLAPAFRAN